MTDVADEACIGVATVYRYYSTKPALVMAISAWIWSRYEAQIVRLGDVREATAAEEFEYYLDSYLDLYRNHKDMLRFNQFFNVYMNQESVTTDAMGPYADVVDRVGARFQLIYAHAKADGTLRTDIPGREMFLTTLHLMMAAVTRYAVGLAYSGNVDPEQELIMLKNMLLREYVTAERPQL
jgi:AcrR family transcriptional regulator